MDYPNALNWIQGLNSYGIRLGLDRMTRLLDLVGRPERGRRVVHVAGTNGKGSTCACLESLFLAAGYSPGLYTSPHLQRFTERIRVSGREIPEPEAARLLTAVRRAAERMEAEGTGHPTHFEAATALAWSWYAETGADPVILETGLGGTHDATNTVEDPLVSVITGVSLDHTDRLGRTVPEIARDKSGIIKPGRPVVAAGPREAIEVITSVATRAGSPLYRVGEGTGDFRWRAREVSRKGGIFDLEIPGPGSGTGSGPAPAPLLWEALRTPLLGRHQLSNAAVAAAAARVSGLPVSEEQVRRGLAAASWPGRLELLPNRLYGAHVLLDGAHNPEGARALAEAVRAIFCGQRPALVVGVMADKDVAGILEPLTSLASSVYATRAGNSRSMDPGELARLIPGATAVWPAGEAIDLAGRKVGPGGLVLVAGSLFLVGEIRSYLVSRPSD